MRNSLAQMGGNTEATAGDAGAEDEAQPGERTAEHGAPDYFVERNGLRFAGSHLIIDLWDAHHLDDVEVVEMALRRAVKAAGATLLHLHVHHFSPNGGVSGIAVLAESHISIHTWPERCYAAIDVFMCGATEPHRVVPILRHAFQTERIVICEQMRGIL
ncbi:MAG: adenosylmethionine decarboxylase [Pseudomonadota bacterium]